MSDRINILIISILIFLLGLFLVRANTPVLSCQISTTCSGANVFRISQTANAHAEIPTLSNYANIVCCQGNYYNYSNSCVTGYNVLKLSSSTNAHVEKNTFTNYATQVCLSSPGNVSCIYTASSCTGTGFETCLATISSDTNAHSSDCTINPYSTRVCCNSTCTGWITGTVRDSDGLPIQSVQLSSKKDLTTVFSANTNSQGVYNITSNYCGNYNLVATHPNYVPQTQSNVIVNHKQQTTVNFTLYLGSSCEQDCTYVTDNIVHAACDGINGCSFYDNVSKAVCDNSQPGWVRDYNATHYVTCSSGAPQPKIEIQATVSCASGNLVKVTRIVVYNGKPVKLVVATCG